MLVILFIPCFLFLFLSFISCYEHFHYFFLFSFNCFWFDDYIMSSILLYQYMCHYSVCYTFNPVNFVSEQDRWKLLCSICGVSYGACIQVSLEFSLFNKRIVYAVFSWSIGRSLVFTAGIPNLP